MTIRVRIEHVGKGAGSIEVTARYRATGAEPGPILHVEILAPGQSFVDLLHTGLDISLRELPVSLAPRSLSEDDGA